MTLVPFDKSKDDAEAIEVVPTKQGGPVDPPTERRTVFATVTGLKDEPRHPILPAWLRSRQQRGQVVHDSASYAWYCVRFHLVRLPKYLVLGLFWAVIGVFRLAGRQIGWWWVTEQTPLRLQTIIDNDPLTWHKLHKEAKATRTWRGIVLGAELVAVVVAVILLVLLAPLWVRLLVLAVVVPAAARLGRPTGKPIIDRVTVARRFVKLTAEIVRGALIAIGVAKEPADITFPVDIHRDGPGFLARVDLPHGTVATVVLEKREALSSAMRLPVDQIWPTVGPDHAGQLDLWVGLQPASKMGQPRWSLASPTARTSFFEPFDFATDQRQRPIKTTLFERNYLIGGVPGSGKSYAGRCVVVGAILDPSVEVKLAEFKGTGDFADIAPLCSTYVCGVDDASIEVGLRVIEWGLAECERRGDRILRAKLRGEAPEGKITPELARRPGSGLHPVLIVIDEAHELFGHDEYGKPAGVSATRLIKRGRALGITVILMTQIPDKASLPPSITRCVNTRWCLAVLDWQTNDMILGTGAYKRGLTATGFRPEDDAGWGLFLGGKIPTTARSFYPAPDVAQAIVGRAMSLRGRVVGSEDAVPTRDVLADVITVMRGAAGAHWEVLAERLAELDAGAYGGLTADAISARLRGLGASAAQIKIAGINRWGVRRSEIERVIDARALGGGDDDGSDEGSDTD